MEVIRNRPGQFEGLNLTQFAAYFDMSRKRPARHRQTDAETAEAEAENVEPNDGGDETGHDNDESVSELPQQPVVDSGVPGRSYQMRAGNPQMWIIRRCKSKIILGKSKMYKPWRDEEPELINVNAEELVNLHSEMIRLTFQEFTRANSDNDGEATRERRHADDANDFGRYTCKEDDEDEGDSQRNADIDEVLTAGARKAARPRLLWHAFQAEYCSKQRLLLTHVFHHIRNNRDKTRYRYFDTAIAPPTNTTFAPLHLLLETGGAGTGKSMLINTLYQSLIREFDSDRDRDMASPSVLLCAPTGIAAAFNILCRDEWFACLQK
ncbi:hypothetical protein HMPREF1544_12078 [Mucor circinelloides 1006PhL]|uniref:ATP-dependent DNA helicase n=1 Tax=Mucor circinelloides f. circinelloides (strain 1006PhL) TaxID=1220926 RepID=S2JFA7_MUCC1|nr:hypothetical protein HMPREF1544_12078 [Mucor circinelloides 1006PhL]